MSSPPLVLVLRGVGLRPIAARSGFTWWSIWPGIHSVTMLFTSWSSLLWCADWIIGKGQMRAPSITDPLSRGSQLAMRGVIYGKTFGAAKKKGT
ncbi:hypothetical protein VTN96DRAFT_9698 [Rasamsonia emersonii]